MLRVVLCENNNDTARRYAKQIADLAQKHGIEMELSHFTSGEALLFHLAETRERWDIIYMDVMMGALSGMETARKLREEKCDAQVVFLTDFADYVYEAFDVNAVQYLVKSKTDDEQFERVLLRAVKRATAREDEPFFFEFDGKLTTVPLAQITYFEIWKRIVTLHCADGRTGRFYASMEQLEQQLTGKWFARAHRSYLVHLPYIAAFQPQTLRLKTGETVPVGVTYTQSLKQAFSDYLIRFQVI